MTNIRWTVVAGIIVGLIFMLCVCAFFAMSRSAAAHEWFSGKSNPVTGYGCCGGSDCEVIEDDAWQTDGRQVSVKWRDGRTYSMPANQMEPTQDPAGRAAACVWGQQLKCFFGPLSY